MTNEQYLPIITARIVERFHPLKVILFGSMARGDARPDSDLDLLVVLPHVENKHSAMVEIFRALSDIPAPVDVLVIGGDNGMSGAVRLAAEAAARVGAGLVTIATRGAHATQLNATRPELMCRGVDDVEQLQPLLARASVLAIGPGLGQAEWGRALLECALNSALPLVRLRIIASRLRIEISPLPYSGISSRSRVASATRPVVRRSRSENASSRFSSAAPVATS